MAEQDVSSYMFTMRYWEGASGLDTQNHQRTDKRIIFISCAAGNMFLASKYRNLFESNPLTKDEAARRYEDENNNNYLISTYILNIFVGMILKKNTHR